MKFAAHQLVPWWCLYVGLSSLTACAQKPELVVQTGHSASVTSVAFSPDGRTLASGGLDTTVKLWDAASGRELRTLRGHTSAVASVAFSPDGRTLASGSWDHTVKFWDAARGRELRTLTGHTGGVTSVAFSPDGHTLASGGQDDAVKLWDAARGRELRTLTGHTGGVTSVAFSPDGRTLASGGSDGTVKLWDAASGRELRSLTGHTGHTGIVASVAFSPDGRTLASGGRDDMNPSSEAFEDLLSGLLSKRPIAIVKLWDAASGRELRTLTAGHTNDVTSVAFNPDGRTLASGGEDDTVKLWDAGSGRELRTLAGHTADSDLLMSGAGEDAILAAKLGVQSVVFSPDGRTLASGRGDQTVKLWDVASGRELRTLTGQANAVTSVAFNPDGRALASGSQDHTVKLWDTGSGRELRSLAGHSYWVGSVVFSPDGRTLASGSADKTVKFWDVASGRELRTLAVPSGFGVDSVAFSPDGRTLASGSDDSEGPVKLWDVASGRELRSLAGHSYWVGSVVFSRDGHTLASGGADHTVKLWDVASGGELRTLTGHTNAVTSVAFSPDGLTLASGGEDNTVKLWDTDIGRELHTLTGHTNAVRSVAFSPDGLTLASGGADNTVKLWDVASGRELRTLTGHTNVVTSVAFSPDGRTLASGSEDRTIMLWDVTGGRELASLFALSQSDWVVSDSEGRFDTNNLDEINGLSWVFPDDPLRALSPEIFMRDYYEPRLLPRLLAREELPKVRPLQNLNRVQPGVKIVSVRQGPSADIAEVRVEVSRAEGQFQRDGEAVTTETDAYDLRLFRAGQLVGQEPEPKAEEEESLKNGVELTSQQLQAWRDARRVRLDARTGKAERTFTVQLPHGQAEKEVEFAAYAFNEDRVKSETVRTTYTVPRDVPVRRAKAYAITIGINGYENPRRNLEFAVKDAEDMAFALQQIKDYEVVSASLLSEAPGDGAAPALNQATKAKIRAVLRVLAGRSDGGELNGVANADRLAKATPDDLVILSFSGHGYTERGGAFYLLPSDSGREDAVTPTELKKFISSEELSEWLRQVDAGQMAMIIDACHSAASVETPGFKPGPMGDHGLGQLAYDKGMSILAASQADDVALEIQNLHQGLLTYALIWEGLRAGEGGKLKADLNGDGVVTLEEWLRYGEQRTPTLYEDAKVGKVKMVSRDSVVNLAFIDKTSQRAQTPSLFDFHKQDNNGFLLNRNRQVVVRNAAYPWNPKVNTAFGPAADALLTQAEEAFRKKRFEEAARLFRQAAEAGNSTAMTHLGYLYSEGLGVPQDYRQARQWYDKAAAAGETDAMTALGEMYDTGRGVVQDYQQERQWLEKAAVAGSADAMFRVGALYTFGRGVGQDYQKARQWYEKAAAAGNAKAMYNLAGLYEEGAFGATGDPGMGDQDYPRARQWYEKAAAAGVAEAMFSLGRLYEDGKGVPQDYEQASQWLQKAAAAGSVAAMSDLGYLYASGQGLAQDYQQARAWYEKAAAAGNANAMGNVGVLYAHGLGVEQDYQQARQWFEKAAAAGDATAMYNLGAMYETGQGVPQDYQQAQQLYEKAAAKGSAEARQRLQALRK